MPEPKPRTEEPVDLRGEKKTASKLPAFAAMRLGDGHFLDPET